MFSSLHRVANVRGCNIRIFPSWLTELWNTDFPLGSVKVHTATQHSCGSVKVHTGTQHSCGSVG